MEWYEIVLGVLLWIAGLFLYGKYRENQSNKYHNNSWKNKRKR